MVFSMSPEINFAIIRVLHWLVIMGFIFNNAVLVVHALE